MHTFLSRLNAVFAFSLSIAALLTLMFALSTSYTSYDKCAKGRVEIVKPAVRRMNDYNMPNAKDNDLGLVQFNLDADFEDCFDWNVKQLYIYITANYKTSDNEMNQIILWDHVLDREDTRKLQYWNRNPEYYFWDDGFGLRGNNVTVTLSMNIIPNAGYLQKTDSYISHTFAFPNTYIK